MKKILSIFVILLITNFSFAQTFKQDVKEAGKEIGKDSKKAGKAIGKESKKAGKAISKTAKKATKSLTKKQGQRKHNDSPAKKDN